MPRAGAARRELRQAKRALAKAERGPQKYKNQKGGIRKPSRPPRNKHGKGKGRHFDEDDAQGEEDDMVMVKDGAATRVGGAAPQRRTGRAEADEEEQEEGTEEPGRFSSLEKKIRALEKKKSSISELKLRMRRGFELDAQQQAKLRTEAKIERELARFRSLLGKELAASDAQRMDEEEDAEAEHAGEEEADEQEEEEEEEEEEAEAPRVPARAEREAELAARVLGDAPETMSRLARQRLLKQAKREERLRRKETERQQKLERKRARLQRIKKA